MLVLLALLLAALSPANHHRARIGALSRDRKPDDPELIGARRDLAAAKLEEHVERVISSWPPLSDEQINRIAARLSMGRAGT